MIMKIKKGNALIYKYKRRKPSALPLFLKQPKLQKQTVSTRSR